MREEDLRAYYMKHYTNDERSAMDYDSWCIGFTCGELSELERRNKAIDKILMSIATSILNAYEVTRPSGEIKEIPIPLHKEKL